MPYSIRITIVGSEMSISSESDDLGLDDYESIYGDNSDGSDSLDLYSFDQSLDEFGSSDDEFPDSDVEDEEDYSDDDDDEEVTAHHNNMYSSESEDDSEFIPDSQEMEEQIRADPVLREVEYLNIPMSVGDSRKRRSTENPSQELIKRQRMNELKKNEKAARNIQIEETKEFFKSSHLECTMCLDESPKIMNPMFCVYCFKVVGCEPCCRKWVEVSNRNIVKRGSSCPLCRHKYTGNIANNLVVIYTTEVTI
uniref:RING-type domain-containing protein n=1 Tax=Parastrongyloides trichosuri TaxID=131310 RepID=A0A0N4ZUD2_PARTI